VPPPRMLKVGGVTMAGLFALARGLRTVELKRYAGPGGGATNTSKWPEIRRRRRRHPTTELRREPGVRRLPLCQNSWSPSPSQRSTPVLSTPITRTPAALNCSVSRRPSWPRDPITQALRTLISKRQTPKNGSAPVHYGYVAQRTATGGSGKPQAFRKGNRTEGGRTPSRSKGLRRVT
jgi:hypothetical protein